MSLEEFIKQGDKIRQADIHFAELEKSREQMGQPMYGWEEDCHNFEKSCCLKVFTSMVPDIVLELKRRGEDTRNLRRAESLAEGKPDAFEMAWAELKAQLLAIMDREAITESPAEQEIRDLFESMRERFSIMDTKRDRRDKSDAKKNGYGFDDIGFYRTADGWVAYESKSRKNVWYELEPSDIEKLQSFFLAKTLRK